MTEKRKLITCAFGASRLAVTLYATSLLVTACGSMPLPRSNTAAAPSQTVAKESESDAKAEKPGLSPAVTPAQESITLANLKSEQSASQPPKNLLLKSEATLDEVLQKHGVNPVLESPTQAPDTSVIATPGGNVETQNNSTPSANSAVPVATAEKAQVEVKSSDTVKTSKVKAANKEKPRVISEEEIKYALANRYYSSGRYQNAIDVLETPGKDKLVSEKSRDLLVLAYVKYARELETKAEMLEAQTVLEKAANMQPKNKKIAEQLTKVRNIRESNRVFKIAMEKYNSGKKEAAFRSFRHVLALNPNHKEAAKYYNQIKTIVVDKHHKHALQLYRQQRLTEAIKEWDQLLDLDPENDLAKIYRSRAVELKQKIEKL